MAELLLEDLAFKILDMTVLAKPVKTARGHLVATFLVKTARFSVSNVRLFVTWDDIYEVSFSRENQVSYLTFNFEEDREELIRVAGNFYEDKSRRKCHPDTRRIVSKHPVRAAAS